jgi:hypothetical protein
MQRLTDLFLDKFLKNPAVWLLLFFFLYAEYFNYQKGEQLDTVCEAIKIPALLPDTPKTPLERAQVICDDRQEGDDMPDDQD